tara:strand:+ start:69 stop:566 length:498 start_codon:yes stop_codon:yes gene_type:complete
MLENYNSEKEKNYSMEQLSQDFSSLQESQPGCYIYKVKPSIRCFDFSIIDCLIERLEKQKLLLGRICFHESHSDPIQSMIIALHNKYKVNQHIHKGVEIIKIIRGELIITEHSSEQLINYNLSKDNLIFCRMSSGVIHSVSSAKGWSVFMEIGTGPFTENTTQYV